MSFASWIQKNVTEAKDSICTEVAKFKSRDLLEAVIAGCTMVAYADGGISTEEKRKMLNYLKLSDQLKVFNKDDIIKTFQKYAEKFEFDNIIGIGEVMQTVQKFRNKPQAQLVVRICCAIGAADGNFDELEQTVVRKMCLELGLNPADFDL